MKKLFFLLSFFAISISAQQEWRGLWVDAWNKGMYNKQDITEMLTIAQKYGYNAVAVQIRCRGDALYFPKYPNSEPRRNNLEPNFDPLQEIITKAHSMGIEVHAWATTFLVASSVPSSPEHVYHKHNDYLTQNSEGEQKIGEGYYLDPGHPQALEWNRNVVLDIVANYDIDGFHFDYIRYPQQNAGYNPVAVERFNKEYNKKGQPQQDDKDFSEWRRAQISNWLRNMYTEIVTLKPEMKVTAATFASRSDAYNHRFQDWNRWMQEGILDANLPMNYARANDIFETRVDDILAHSHGRHVYMGVGSYLLDIDASISQLLYARNGKSQGLILFSYANNSKSGKSANGYDEIYKKLFQNIAQTPDMPWKNKYGHIFGQVIPPTTTQGTITVSLPLFNKNVNVDHEGRFSFPNIPEGTYELHCNLNGIVVQKCSVKVQKQQTTICNSFLLK